MAIMKVPGYAAREGIPVIKVPKAPKPVAAQPSYWQREGNGMGAGYAPVSTVGYTGSGWKYPSAGPPQAAAVPPTPPPAGAGNQPFNWDAYLKQIENDPVFIAGQGNLTTNMNNWRRQLESAIRGGVVQGGWNMNEQLAKDPTLAGYLNEYISPETWDTINAAAAGNQLSDKAQLERQLTQQKAGAAYDQAARGTLGSGSQAVQLTNVADANVLARNTAQNQLLQALRGDVGTYLGNVTQGQQALEGTRGEVAARLAALEGAAYQTGNFGEGTQTDVPGAQGLASAATGPPKPTGVSWGGQDVTSVGQMRAILAKSGVSYQTWKANHPAAAAKLEGMG